MAHTSTREEREKGILFRGSVLENRKCSNWPRKILYKVKLNEGKTLSNSVQSFPAASLGKMCCILSELFVITKHEMLPALPPSSSPPTSTTLCNFFGGKLKKHLRIAAQVTAQLATVQWKSMHTHTDRERVREKWELALLMSCACHLPLPPHCPLQPQPGLLQFYLTRLSWCHFACKLHSICILFACTVIPSLRVYNIFIYVCVCTYCILCAALNAK